MLLQEFPRCHEISQNADVDSEETVGHQWARFQRVGMARAAQVQFCINGTAVHETGDLFVAFNEIMNFFVLDCQLHGVIQYADPVKGLGEKRKSEAGWS